jgi:hypothetical protein
MNELTFEARNELLNRYRQLFASGVVLVLAEFPRPVDASGFDELIANGFYKKSGNPQKRLFRITAKGVAQAKSYLELDPSII